MKTLKRGQLAVDKKRLVEHCHELHQALNYMDKVMEEPPSKDRDRKFADGANAINLALHILEHFEMGVSLEKLGTECPIPKAKDRYISGELPACFMSFIRGQHLSKEWDKHFQQWLQTDDGAKYKKEAGFDFD